MRGTNTLRRIVRGILLEAEIPPPDETRVQPDEALGQYVFPDNRATDAYKEVDEADTDLEKRFFKALDLHYDANNHGPLRAIWPEIVELNRQGLYPNLLRSPRGRVYRLMSVDPDRAALFMGVPESRIKGRPGAARSAPNPPPFKPRGLLSSWTTDPEAMVQHTGHTFVEEKPGECTLLLVADTSEGEFLMNPIGFASGWRLGNMYKHEYEVIGGGEIPLIGAAWMWHGVPNFDMHKFSDEIEALISGVSSDVNALGPVNKMSTEDRRAAEQLIWAQFVQGVEDAAKAYSGGGPEDEPVALKVVRKYLERPRQQATNPTAFDKLYDEIARTQGIEHAISHSVGRWLVTAAGFLKSDLLMTIHEVEGGAVGDKSPETILRQLMSAAE